MVYLCHRYHSLCLPFLFSSLNIEIEVIIEKAKIQEKKLLKLMIIKKGVTAEIEVENRKEMEIEVEILPECTGWSNAIGTHAVYRFNSEQLCLHTLT